MRVVALLLSLWASRAVSFECGRVHFVGNSVSRGWAFALSARRSGTDDVAGREEQKNACGSTEGERCRLANAVDFTWAWSVWSPLVETALAQEADVTVVNVGSHYVFSNVSDFALRAAVEAAPLRSAMTRSPAAPNVWLRTSTRACDDVYGMGVDEVNAKLRIVNRVLIRELSGRGARVFDAWTDETSCAVYDDRVHSRALIQTQLSAWVRVACPNVA
jgi:hypothetical protein